MDINSAGPPEKGSRMVHLSTSKVEARAENPSEQQERPLTGSAATQPVPKIRKGELRISVPYDHHVEVRVVDPETGEAIRTINEAPPPESGGGHG